MRSAQPLAGRQQRVGLGSPAAHRLVERPRADRRLAQRLHSRPRIAIAISGEALGELVALLDELVERRPVQAVDLLVDVHEQSLRRNLAERVGALEAWHTSHTYFR